ncbi:hypothetical protein M3Y97_01156900 [Aphelenchoides bicaudatus]|nr:hypothetical protein M3Y97_01156900 [Aphelenchoides bicaudatus]
MAAFRVSLFLLAFCAFYVSARTESTAVDGNVYCKQQPIQGVEVKLVDHYKLSSDVTMDDVTTDKAGFYSVSGWNDPTLGRGITPEVKIYHNCGGGFSKCYQFSVP